MPDVDGGDVADQQDDTQPVLRRSERVRHRPDYYAEGAYIAAGRLEEGSWLRVMSTWCVSWNVF